MKIILLINFISNSSNSSNIFLTTVTLIVLCVIVIGGAYFTARWLGQLQYQQNKTKNMQIIETMRITPNKMIQLIRIGNEYYAISITK